MAPPNCAEETFEHVLTCPHPLTKHHRDTVLLCLQEDLTASNFPPKMIRMILYGFSQWLDPLLSSSSKSLTYGSVHLLDMILTAAYTEQFSRLGCFQFTLGWLSRQWFNALCLHTQNSTRPVDQTYLISILIQHIWKFTSSMWTHQKEIVHGASVEVNARIILTTLQENVREHYHQFETNNGYPMLASFCGRSILNIWCSRLMPDLKLFFI
jgi:hypothetical protein